MSTIAFVLDHEEGHLIPTFPLASRLVERGHRVVYLTLADGSDFVRQNGFDAVPILEEVFPKGAIPTLRETTGPVAPIMATEVSTAADGKLRVYESYLSALVESRELTRVVDTLKVDLFMTSSLLALTALVLRFRFDLPVVLLTSYLRLDPKSHLAREVEGVLMQMRRGAAAFFELMLSARPQARRLADVSREVVEMRELILCPEALEIPRPGRAPESEVYYVEAPAGRQRGSEAARAFPWERLDPSRKLLLCSMGSQSFHAGTNILTRFYRAVAKVMRDDPSWQLVLASGGMVEERDLPDLPGDAIVARWVPQLALLQRAAVMITHGGLGAVRESISNGVPMVVFPITRDQPDNARRVVHHGLGLAGDLAAATADSIRESIERVDREPSFRARVAEMGERFAAVERSGIGVQLIEQAAAASRPLRAVAG